MRAVTRPYIGQHCETVTTGTLLGALGCDLSEPMIFGLGEALGFVFLNLSTMPLGFIGGRSKPYELTAAACRNLGLTCAVEETTSTTKSWDRLSAHVADGRPVGLQLDCYYLPYFTRPPHFAGHFVAAIALDDEVTVVDTVAQGSVHRVPREALQAARHATGPMSAKARTFTVSGEVRRDLPTGVAAAIRANAASYLSPAFGGMGALGLAKLARVIPRWPASEDLALVAELMERGGTGGALFRNLYRDFLTEAADLLPDSSDVRCARDLIATSAEQWTAMAAELAACATDGDPVHLAAAAALCRPIADAEVAAMEILAAT